LDNQAIAKVLEEIADLLEIKGENPFKIRAYRNGAEIAANHPHALATLDPTGLREIPGIGKDLAARIRELADTGRSAFHQELVAEFPASVLDLLHLQGVGPKTVATLYRDLGIRTLDDLERAAHGGRIATIKGMGPKKQALILTALDERKRHAGRHLLSTLRTAADALIAHLHAHTPGAAITPVGSFRRGAETCGDLDLLADGADRSLMDAFVAYGPIERVLGHGDTKSSVLLGGGLQADLRLVSSDSRGAAMQYFTGSKAHNIALRDRAIDRGFKLNEYGLFRVDDPQRPEGTEGVKVAGDTEEGIYDALGLAWIPPELREGRGELQAAETHTLPSLITRADIRGDLHMHTTETDGREDLVAMIEAARDAGHEYIAITDHTKSLAMANGMDETRARRHADRIRSLDGRYGVRLLAGVECDIRPDGSMDLDDDCLSSLDIVIASVHSAFNMDEAQMTARVLRALENPHVDVLGHATGRLLLRRPPYPLNIAAVVDAAARHGVAIEINSQPYRLDFCDLHARLARERGVKIVISTDAHARPELGNLPWGVATARRAWLSAPNVLNTRRFDAFTAALRRNRR
jgi:DNA polymerase (family 10)